MNVHTLDQLTDSTEPGGCPAMPASTWMIDVLGYEEPTGIYSETLDHNRDLAKGLLDPEYGFLTIEENEPDHTYAEALALGRQGGERVYDQEQGFAPLILEPGVILTENGLVPNGDAFAAAFLNQSSPRTDLDIPELVQSRRHWRDIGPDEQNALITGFDAETHDVLDPDALVAAVNDPSAMMEGGIPPTHALDGITVEDLEESLGEQGAANYLSHLYQMAFAQLDDIERRVAHATECRLRHPVAMSTNGRYALHIRSTKRGPGYMEITQPWRERNQARKAQLASRVWHGKVNHDPSMPPVPAPRTALAIQSSGLRRTGYVPQGPIELPAFDHAQWWALHGTRIHAQIAEWGIPFEEEPGEWWDAAEDAYYVLRCT